jgi:hypothetical protein
LILDNAINLNKAFNEYFNFEYNELFNIKIKQYKCQIIFDMLRHSEIRAGFNACSGLFKEYSINGVFSFANLWMFLKSSFLGIVKIILVILGLKHPQT